MMGMANRRMLFAIGPFVRSIGSKRRFNLDRNFIGPIILGLFKRKRRELGENEDGIDALDYDGEKFVKDKVGETLLLVAVDALPREKKVRLTLNLEKVSVNEKTEKYLNPVKKRGERYVNSRALADYSLKFLHPS